jgi:DNA modification methylase
MKTNEKINIVYVDAVDIKPAEYNPRTWDKTAEDKLTESIKRFGLIDPLIVNSRFQIINKLGIKKVPVVYVNIPDINKEKELNLRLNRNTGDWDYVLLKTFNIEQLLDIGFNDDDLAAIWDENLGVEDYEFDVSKELTNIKEVTAKPGDIYKLGSHHLLGCGDATDRDFLAKIIKKLSIDMIYFDPPYNIELNYNTGIGTKGKYGAYLTKDNKSDKQYRDFIYRAIENGLHFAKENCHVFCYCDEKYIGTVQDIYKSLKVKSMRVCLWIKDNQNPTPQIAFNKMYEPCVYGVVGKPYLAKTITNLNEILNKEVSTGNRAIDDILDLINIWLVKRLPTALYIHPTEKPPTLHEKPLRRCTQPGDTVLDLFGGSGSTLIACEELHRNCVMVEIEPIFIELIKKRYEKLTGKETIRVN